MEPFKSMSFPEEEVYLKLTFESTDQSEEQTIYLECTERKGLFISTPFIDTEGNGPVNVDVINSIADNMAAIEGTKRIGDSCWRLTVAALEGVVNYLKNHFTLRTVCAESGTEPGMEKILDVKTDSIETMKICAEVSVSGTAAGTDLIMDYNSRLETFRFFLMSEEISIDDIASLPVKRGEGANERNNKTSDSGREAVFSETMKIIFRRAERISLEAVLQP